MTQLTAEQVAQFAYQAGFRGNALITAVAISHAETDPTPFDPASRGDVGLEDNTWGASIGLWQIRSLRADMNTGRTRDEAANLDPATNARHAYTISGGGTNWTPWSTYNNGAYKQYLAEGQTASANAASGITPGSPAPTPDNGQPILGISGQPVGPDLPLTIGGRPATGELGEAIIGGTVDFSINAISEVTVLLNDPDYSLSGRFRLQPDGTLHLFDLPYRIVEYRVSQGVGAPNITLVAQPEGVVRMKEISPASRADVSPTDYMQQITAAAGLNFVGESSAVVASIGPAQVPDTRSGGLIPGAVVESAMRPETAWEVGLRLGNTLGFYVYEAAGTFFFASAQYLQGRGQNVQISTDDMGFGPQAGPTFTGLGIPTVTITKRDLDDSTKKAASSLGGWLATDLSYMNVTIQGTVAREDGINLRPGMRARWTGVGPIMTGISELVTRVTWNLADLTSPVNVEAGSLLPKIGTARTAADDTASLYGTAGTSGETLSHVYDAKPTVLDFVTECLRQAGNKYTWGGEDPSTGFDCSGLIQWAAAQMNIKLPRTAGPQYQACVAAGLGLTVDQAANTRGAILYRSPGALPGYGEHIAVSLGDGVHTIEARGSAYGVIEGGISGRVWTGGGKLPGFTY
jgi:cell wall-associated NlpC family hydrolase